MDLGSGNMGDLLGNQFGSKFESDSKKLVGYCSTILEEREEAIVAALMNGKLAKAGVGKSKEDVAKDLTDIMCKWEKRKKKSPCPLDDEGKIEL